MDRLCVERPEEQPNAQISLPFRKFLSVRYDKTYFRHSLEKLRNGECIDSPIKNILSLLYENEGFGRATGSHARNLDADHTINNNICFYGEFSHWQSDAIQSK